MLDVSELFFQRGKEITQGFLSGEYGACYKRSESHYKKWRQYVKMRLCLSEIDRTSHRIPIFLYVGEWMGKIAEIPDWKTKRDEIVRMLRLFFSMCHTF